MGKMDKQAGMEEEWKTWNSKFGPHTVANCNIIRTKQENCCYHITIKTSSKV
jgi:hypothetical protein